MMLFRIAEVVGSTVADLHSKITVAEFNGWVSYLNSKPPDVTEVQLAIIANIISSGLGAKNSNVEDYILSKTTKKPKEATTHTAFDSFNALAKTYKGPNEK